jgi:ribosomal-protein-alanine N-acetyltransferase
VLARVAADEAEILTLAVTLGARRSGMGRRLLLAAMAEAATRGAASMVLEVATGNVAALGLYRSVGFSPVGHRRAYYAGGADAVIMRAGVGESTGAQTRGAASP